MVFDFIRKQFVDVLQWTEDSDGVLAWRYPIADMEIQNGASLTVRDSQMALFVDEGKMADLFGPGRYTLNTQTLPVLTNLKNWDKFFESPFKSDVIFFSTRLQLDRKWGTPTPITVRDAEFGAIRLRAFGNYAYKLADPKKLYTEVAGTRGTYTADDLDGQLIALVQQSLADTFAKSGVPFLDLAANQMQLAQTMQTGLADAFARYGLALDSFTVQSVSLPENVQAALDAKTKMNIVGDLNRYTQYQTAESIPTAAANPGGLGAMGAGLAVGMNMGQAMVQSMAPAPTVPAAAAPTPNTSAAQNPANDLAATLTTLHDLVQKGVLSQAEFEAKKAELLSRL
jgi:membrane protease subunit (stomatin/prohibitin family)